MVYESKEQLKEKARTLIIHALQEAEMRQGCTSYGAYADILLKQLEPIVFKYAPLSESIQWALNSGDGTYRP